MNGFEVIEPPPNGLTTLRQRLVKRQGIVAERAGLLASLGCVAATLLVVWSVPGLKNQRTFSKEIEQQFTQPMADLEPSFSRAQPLPSDSADVLMYRVMSLPAERDEPHP